MNPNSSNRFSGKVAIVTGSGRGLGATTALRLAREGADVAINDINAENARSVAGEIEKLGRRSFVSTHDVSSYAQANAFVSEAKSALGRIDVLVNNAGITRDSMLHK